MPALSQAVVQVPAGRGDVDLLERDEQRGAALHLEDGAVALLGHAHRLQLALPEMQVSLQFGFAAFFSELSYLMASSTSAGTMRPQSMEGMR